MFRCGLRIMRIQRRLPGGKSKAIRDFYPLLYAERRRRTVYHMIRIGICDDEAEARDGLRFALEKVLREGREEIVYEFVSGKNAASWLKKHPGEIDLLFLDVEMKEPNGMETARYIRTFDEEILIVFVTGHKDYVFDGYEADALDYVLKPAEPERLKRILERVRRIMEKNREKTFIFKNMDGAYRLPFGRILYFYSDRRKVSAVTREKEYPFYGKLDEIQTIAGKNFVRIHQRYLVNVRKVERIGKNEVEVEGILLPVSRNMKADALAALARSVLEE